MPRLQNWSYAFIFFIGLAIPWGWVQAQEDDGSEQPLNEESFAEDSFEAAPAENKDDLVQEEAAPSESKNESESIELEPLDPTEEPEVSSESLFEDFSEPEPVQPESEPDFVNEPSYPEPTVPAPQKEVPVQQSFADTGRKVEITDSPDLGLESQLHDIYVNFHSKAIPRDEWNMLVGARQTETYRIQKGDNLWNISGTLFNDGNYWPKIWSLNSSIQNPHLIEPGDTLRFVMGTEEEPPTFTVGGTTQEYDPQLSNPSMSMEEEPTTDLPPPLVEVKPLLKNLPPSLPEWRTSNVSGKYDDLGIQIEGRPKLVVDETLYLKAYVTDSFNSLGSVEEVEGGVTTATDNQYIYIDVQEGAVRPGSEVLLVKNEGPIQPESKYIKEKSLGTEVRILGE
ncbi:MAG: LysM peptidoglycan-binding domain-containing protein, partial [Bdellovibrionales bacterium]|nr:LysM peptidoglycan-binding domain-containing protein [Bdellovibrionales bacterium]